MRSFLFIALAIILLPVIQYTGLPRWVLLIPTAYLAWIFIVQTWYAIKRTFFSKDEWFM